MVNEAAAPLHNVLDFEDSAATASYPRRIVCLTEETVETLYLLGQQHRIVGVSGYACRPPEARQKPRVGAFTNIKLERVVELGPDLVLTFSDLQAEISRDLISRGISVYCFNQRSVREILEMMLTLGRLLDCREQAKLLVGRIASDLRGIAAIAALFPHRPRVFFEEWKDPLISGIQWVEELVEIAGGDPIFPELRFASLAKDRIVRAEDVVSRNPEIVFASWCGMKVNFDTIRKRTGWERVAAVEKGKLFEVKSTYILQPGPAALTEGVRQIHEILKSVASPA